MHKLLKRQLKRLKLTSSIDDGNISAEKWQLLMDAISSSYGQADNDRKLLERSMTLMSNELTQRNRDLQSHLDKLEKKQEIIHFQSHHDALTQLPNRILLMEKITHAVSYCELNESCQVAILFVDLDHFKKINDTCGHHRGDEILCNIAKRLRDCLRGHDTLARFGGDEFVLVLEKITNPKVASDVANRVLESMSKSVVIEDHKFHISASIGISLFPADDNAPQELVRKANMAMYQAKDAGRNSIRFFDQPLEELALREISLEYKIHKAIENSEFTLVYQPKVSGKDYSIQGFEALLRWQPEGQAPISPVEFIPVAEKSGLIKHIGDWVLKKTCEQIQDWRGKGFEDFAISINLSTKEVLEKGFSEKISSTLNRYNIPENMLEVEITETALMQDLSAAQKTLGEIQALGVKISLDDFGTGYSSLSYLQNLPIDYLKIDKSFVLGLDSNAHSSAIALSIITLGHNLNIKIVAEGAENLESVNILSKNKCDLIQGYYFYRPLPAQDAEDLLTTQKNKQLQQNKSS